MRSAIFLGFAILTACATVEKGEPLTVAEIAPDLLRFHGTVVTVRGWLDECNPYSCGLFQTREEATAHHYGEHMLSLASRPGFDRRALFRGPAEVIIRGRVDATCRQSDIVCMDRASELTPFTVKFLEQH